VFLEIANTRAISEIDTPSDTRNRRISAQSSTLNTCSLPGSPQAWISPGSWSIFSCRPLVSFHLPSTPTGPPQYVPACIATEHGDWNMLVLVGGELPSLQ
jgi:hypothetical protein